MAEGEIKDDSEGLNAVAWGLVTEFDKPGKELIDAAADIVKKALGLSKDEPALLDTLARIQFLQGLKEEAIKTLEKAIAKADDEDLKGQLKLSLESMKKGELPKTPEEVMEAEGE
jgi:tetratricopeptide (TPR) repeat protein